MNLNLEEMRIFIAIRKLFLKIELENKIINELTEDVNVSIFNSCINSCAVHYVADNTAEISLLTFAPLHTGRMLVFINHEYRKNINSNMRMSVLKELTK